MNKLQISARMKIREGKLEGFKQQAAELPDVEIKVYSFLQGLESGREASRYPKGDLP